MHVCGVPCKPPSVHVSDLQINIAPNASVFYVCRYLTVTMLRPALKFQVCSYLWLTTGTRSACHGGALVRAGVTKGVIGLLKRTSLLITAANTVTAASECSDHTRGSVQQVLSADSSMPCGKRTTTEADYTNDS